MLRPRRLFLSAFIFLVSIGCLFLWPAERFLGLIFLLFLVFLPIIQYRGIAKAIDSDRIWTDPKTLEFSPSQLQFTGPNWKSEWPWTRYTGFSEDDAYF